MGKIIEVDGDLVKMTDIKIFIHQCNCFGTMGAGIAKQIADTYPEVAKADRTAMKYFTSEKIFGTVLPVKTSDGRVCINMYSQYHYGKGKQTDSEAFVKCLNGLVNYLNQFGLNSEAIKVGFPRMIGCGLAGGNWNEIYGYIKDFSEKINNPVYIVNYISKLNFNG